MADGYIQVRRGDYQLNIMEERLPDLTAGQYKQLMKLVKGDPWNEIQGEWDRLGSVLDAGLARSEAALETAKGLCKKLYRPVARGDRSEEAAAARAHNHVLESDVARAEKLAQKWKMLKTKYEKERTR